jgi:hypothetical protein
VINFDIIDIREGISSTYNWFVAIWVPTTTSISEERRKSAEDKRKVGGGARSAGGAPDGAKPKEEAGP